MAVFFPDAFDALFQFQQALDELRSSDWLETGPSGGGAYPPTSHDGNAGRGSQGYRRQD